VGVGPLYAGAIALRDFEVAPLGVWLTDTSPAMEWVALAILGYFFGWLMVALSIDYEDDLRVSGRLAALRALVAAEAPNGPLQVFAERHGGLTAAALHTRGLAREGYRVRRFSAALWVYGVVRGSMLAAGVTSLWLMAAALRGIAVGELDARRLGALAGTLVLGLVCARASGPAGRALARRIAQTLAQAPARVPGG